MTEPVSGPNASPGAGPVGGAGPAGDVDGPRLSEDDRAVVREETLRSEVWRQTEAARIAGMDLPDSVQAVHAGQPVVTADELVAGDLRPDENGVRIDGRPLTTTEMFELSQQHGREYLLTMQRDPETGDRTYRLYGGTADSVRVPPGLPERPVAHTHPNAWPGREFPSAADMWVAQSRYDRLREAGVPDERARERALIVHGPGPDGSTLYHSGPGKDPVDGPAIDLEQTAPDHHGSGRGRVPGLAGVAVALGAGAVEVGDRVRDGEGVFEAAGGVVSDLAVGAYDAVVTGPRAAADEAYATRLAEIDRDLADGRITERDAELARERASADYYTAFGGDLAGAIIGDDVVDLLGQARLVEAGVQFTGNIATGLTEGAADLLGGAVDHTLAGLGYEEAGAAVRGGLTDGAHWLTTNATALVQQFGAELGFGQPETEAERRAREARMEAVWNQPMP